MVEMTAGRKAVQRVERMAGNLAVMKAERLAGLWVDC